MARCEVCGNDYDDTFEVRRGGVSHTFDCFECAIHAMAPKCANCAVPVMGHGVQKGEQIFCCGSCAEKKGFSEFVDRA